MSRDYQYNYSQLKPSVFNTERRHRKAETIARVCQDFASPGNLSTLQMLDIGSSSGIIDNYLADYFGHVTGIDIDAVGMQHAQEKFNKDNLIFKHDDAMQLNIEDNSFDVVVCTQIYEHVPDATSMFNEIFRVLRPGGFCYFAGNNRLMIMEPHYHLPFLSVLPRPLAHKYLSLAGKGDYYHEKHFTYWTLRKLCRAFCIEDYSSRTIAEPEKFAVDYMLAPGTLKWRLANTVARYARWATPMIWILQKPASNSQ